MDTPIPAAETSVKFHVRHFDHSDFHKKRTKVTANGHKHLRIVFKTIYPIVMCPEIVCEVRSQAEQFDSRKITNEYDRHLVLSEVLVIIDYISDAKIRSKWRASITTRDSACRILAHACFVSYVVRNLKSRKKQRANAPRSITHCGHVLICWPVCKVYVKRFVLSIFHIQNSSCYVWHSMSYAQDAYKTCMYIYINTCVCVCVCVCARARAPGKQLMCGRRKTLQIFSTCFTMIRR